MKHLTLRNLTIHLLVLAELGFLLVFQPSALLLIPSTRTTGIH